MNWYIAIAHRDSTVTAIKALEGLGAEVYFPVEKFIRKLRNKLIPVETNALHKYLLVRGAAPEKINAVRGVWRLLLDADGNTGIATQAEVDHLKKGEVDGIHDHRRDPSRFKPQSTVRIIAGLLEAAMDGETGIVRRSENARGLVRIFIAGRVVNLSIDDLMLA